jgi:hypothetical protein
VFMRMHSLPSACVKLDRHARMGTCMLASAGGLCGVWVLSGVGGVQGLRRCCVLDKRLSPHPIAPIPSLPSHPIPSLYTNRLPPSSHCVLHIGIVYYSSRKIAAYRALESASEDPLFDDPLAEALAGPKALNDARRVSAAAKPTRRTVSPDNNPTTTGLPATDPSNPTSSSSHPQATPMEATSSGAAVAHEETSTSTREEGGEGRSRPRMVTLIAIRTKWFDDRILQALREGAGPRVAVGLQPDAATRVGVELRVCEPPRPLQVVLLGAGMDSRAWRLPLPPGAAC